MNPADFCGLEDKRVRCIGEAPYTELEMQLSNVGRGLQSRSKRLKASITKIGVTGLQTPSRFRATSIKN